MSNLRNRSAHDEGFTLVEMLAAMVVVTGVLMALGGVFVNAATSVQKQQYRAKATRVALDMNEHLRLAAYDGSELTLGTHTGTGHAPDGSAFPYTYVVTERSAGTGNAGDVIKEITTTVTWTGARGGRVTYVTALAADAKDIGVPPGYAQTIRSMVVTPAPSTVVDYNGYTASDIVITLILSGHSVDDVVHITWNDDRGASTPSATATTTNGYQWVANLGHGGSGIHYKVPGGIDPATGKGYYKNLTFTARTDTGLVSTSTLPVYGPTDNPPTITSFSVAGSATNDIKVFSNGQNKWQNTDDVTASCVVSRLTSPDDSVVLSYYNALGQVTQVPMKPTTTTVSSSSSTWTVSFARSSTYFYYVDVSPKAPTTVQWGCTVSRATDGGPDATTVSMSVHR